MDRDLAQRLSCIVCGIETKRHTGWFLVMDNCWLDRVKIFAWHPVLARSERIRGVCGKPHLKAVLTHWLNHASLQLVGEGSAVVPPAADKHGGSDPSFAAVGRALGELAVARDPLSPGWTGSPEAMECILNALIGETESRLQPLALASLERLLGYPRNYAFH
jgi:hypothetical protein